jgi:hypothetical protein
MAMILLARIPSSSGSIKYSIAKDEYFPVTGEGGYACACRGWTSKVPRRDCKHIKLWKRWMEIVSDNELLPGWEVTVAGWRIAQARHAALFPQRPSQQLVGDGPERRSGRPPEEPSQLEEQVAAAVDNAIARRVVVGQRVAADVDQMHSPRVWPPLRSSLPDPNVRPVRPVEHAAPAPGPACETCGVQLTQHAEFCRLTDVEAKQRADREKEGNPSRFKVLDIY